MNIPEYIDLFPDKAGIYIFKDAFQKIIYVGKAKSLKKRVKSYFQKNNDWKVSALINEHHSVEFILTKNETEALLLEAQLIKTHQPKFNVLLKSGQPFVYLYISKDTLPTIELVRNKRKKGLYFGPFLHKRQARGAYRYLMETFKLQTCNSSIEGGCLRYHIGLCAGTCKADFNQSDYIFRLQLAINLLEGNFDLSEKQVKNKIAEAIKEKDFEKARQLYEYAENLSSIFETLKTKFSENKYNTEITLATAPIKKAYYHPDLSLAEKVQKKLETSKPIHTIDCFDISHFQSNYIVGSCVRFTDGIPDKNKFRRFKIKTLDQQNDYAALQEIIQRRYKKEQDLPDLILVDGGKGQLSAAQKVLPTIELASLAKREETIFMNRFPHGILLDIKDDVGKLLIALRDYAHHFAISYHRLKRNRAQENDDG